MNGYLTTVGRKFLLGLKPPSFPTDWNDARQVQEYRVKRNEWCHIVSVAIFGTYLLQGVVVGPLIGWWPDGWNRVAWSQDIAAVHTAVDVKLAAQNERVTKVEGRVTKVEEVLGDIATEQRMARATQITGQIFSARKEQCAMIAEGRNARVWTEQLRRLEAEYRELMKGERFDTPACAEI